MRYTFEPHGIAFSKKALLDKGLKKLFTDQTLTSQNSPTRLLKRFFNCHLVAVMIGLRKRVASAW